MCDLRIIQAIKLNGSDTIIPIGIPKICNGHTYGPAELYFPNIKDPGFYHISASGGYHGYFTGSKWLYEDIDYQVIKSVKPSGLFYDFIH